MSAYPKIYIQALTFNRGGNDPAIVCPDVDIPAVATGIAQLAFYNSGQVCIAVKRVYVHKDIYAEFLATFTAIVKSFGVGNGLDAGIFQGPVQNKPQFERVQEFLADIKKNDQKVVAGGAIMETKAGGYFIQPTIVDNPKDDSMIVKEEPFGPVVPLLMWENEQEVIDRSNDCNVGLGASVWSKDIERATRIGEQLEAGSVWINEHMGIKPWAHFGGHKNSGIGGEWGVDGLKGFCNTQTLFCNK